MPETTNLEPAAYGQKIQKEILRLIRDELVARHIDSKRVQEIARFVLKTISSTSSIDDVYNSLSLIQANCPELTSLQNIVAGDKSSQLANLVIAEMVRLIKEGKYQEATNRGKTFQETGA